ncbi:hypothetical protein [Heliophilum fasciatum]|uniref:Uncharacterized protein n=1 Tax=Heliophilum fasciatum TaxID=35700 RepID=A0A4R2RP25_9FIRM|nr:hypothetical protein [Heliophilum fasciatum]MCW2277717.1 hypothetical protein [Heliophilum fasciatum]TCP64788.1 hypothetical protein EDD73_108141 [Heliophilum fasciatum]
MSDPEIRDIMVDLAELKSDTKNLIQYVRESFSRGSKRMDALEARIKEHEDEHKKEADERKKTAWQLKAALLGWMLSPALTIAVQKILGVI